MKVRPYESSDRERVLELHQAHGAHFLFPDPDDRLNAIYLLLEDDDGTLLGAIVGRLTVEASLMLNRQQGAPTDRWAWARHLYEAGSRAAYNLGLGEEHFWVPAELRSYARRLASVPGFLEEKRHSFTVDLKSRYVP